MCTFYDNSEPFYCFANIDSISLLTPGWKKWCPCHLNQVNIYMTMVLGWNAIVLLHYCLLFTQKQNFSWPKKETFVNGLQSETLPPPLPFNGKPELSVETYTPLCAVQQSCSNNLDRILWCACAAECADCLSIQCATVAPLLQSAFNIHQIISTTLLQIYQKMLLKKTVIELSTGLACLLQCFQSLSVSM